MTYGCYNRPPLRAHVTVQDGWHYDFSHDGSVYTRQPVIRTAPDPMTRECQYTISTPDPQCAGCKHEAKR